MQLLADQGQAADKRQLPDRVRVDGRLQLTPVDDDLLRAGKADRDRVVALATHHHAFDDGLPAIKEWLVLSFPACRGRWHGPQSGPWRMGALGLRGALGYFRSGQARRPGRVRD